MRVAQSGRMIPPLQQTVYELSGLVLPKDRPDGTGPLLAWVGRREASTESEAMKKREE